VLNMSDQNAQSKKDAEELAKKAREEARSGGTNAPATPEMQQRIRDMKAAEAAKNAPTTRTEMGKRYEFGGTVATTAASKSAPPVIAQRFSIANQMQPKAVDTDVDTQVASLPKVKPVNPEAPKVSRDQMYETARAAKQLENPKDNLAVKPPKVHTIGSNTPIRPPVREAKPLEVGATPIVRKLNAQQIAHAAGMFCIAPALPATILLIDGFSARGGRTPGRGKTLIGGLTGRGKGFCIGVMVSTSFHEFCL